MNAAATMKLATGTGMPPSVLVGATSGHHARPAMNAAWLTMETPTTAQMNPSQRRCDTTEEPNVRNPEWKDEAPAL